MHCRLAGWEDKVEAILANGGDVEITGFDYSRFFEKLKEIAERHHRELKFKSGKAWLVKP